MLLKKVRHEKRSRIRKQVLRQIHIQGPRREFAKSTANKLHAVVGQRQDTVLSMWQEGQR